MNQDVRTTASILNVYPTRIAMLDSHGVIVSVNEAWREFPRENALLGSDFGVGQNYLDIGERASGAGTEEARAVAVGIRRVLKGNASDFSIDYPGPSPAEPRWFQLKVTAMGEKPVVGAVVLHIDITQSKRMEEDLRQNRNMLLHVLDSVPQSIFWKDRNSVYLGCNKVYARLAGLADAKEIVGKTDFDLPWPRQQSEGYIADDREVMETNQPKFHLIEMEQRADGTTSWSETTKVPLTNSAGHVDGMLGIFEDITERKQTEEALQESELQFRTLIEQAPIAIGVSRDGIGMYANQKFLQTFGLRSAEEYIGRPLFDYYAPQCQEEIKERIRDRSLGLPVPDEYESIGLRADGSMFPILVAVSRAELSDGMANLGFVTDITELKKAQQEAADERARFKFIFESVHIGISLDNWRSDGSDLMLINDAHLRICGITREQEREEGRDLWPRISVPEDYERQLLLFRQMEEGKTDRFSLDKRYIRPSGEVVWVNLSMLRRRCDDGSFEYLTTVVDITERKRAENSLIESESKFRQLAESITDVFWITSPDLRQIHYVSPGYERIWGRSPEELYANPQQWEEAILPEDRDRVLGVFDALRGDEPSVSAEYRIVRPDGAVRWVHDRGFQVRNTAGHLVQLNGVAADITERKQAERALADSQSHHRSLVENMLEGYAYCRIIYEQDRVRDFIYLEVNSAFETLTGLKNVAGKKVSEVIPGIHESNPELFEVYSRVVLTGKPERYETYVEPLGIWFSISVYSYEKEHFTAVFENITERKQAEVALKESEERFSLLSQAAFEGICVSENGRICDINDQWAKMFGYERDELIGKAVIDLVAPESRAIVAEAIRTDKEMVYESRVLRKDGSVFYAETQSKVVHVGNRKLRMTTLRDITERKQTEAQLRLQSSALEASANAIVITDCQGTIEWANAAFTANTGYSVAEAIGKNPRLLKSGKHDEKFYRNLWDTISAGKVWHGELVNRRKDGTVYDEEMTITPIRDGKGEIEHFIAVKQDITERKKIEANFLRAQRVESLGVLAGGIAHDLNNILAPIVMSIDILNLTATDPQTKSVLETIRSSAKRGADVVQQVLSFARGVTGEKVEIEPKDLLKDLEKIIKDIFPKDIRLQFSILKDTWTVLGDPTQIHQVLLNLCLNARDAMPQGGSLTVNIENRVLDEQYAAMTPRAKAGRYVLISVTDSGMGIPPEILDKIFEPFFTTKEVGKGTGLGLSTSMGIVKSHDGIINVYSEPGKGTTVKVYLPVPKHSAEEHKYQTAQISLPRGSGEMVLVVDDEASILTITSQTLQAFGYRVLTASDGAEVVAIYVQHQDEIDVVLTDMMMPIMDGPATTHSLLRMNPAVKIVAASGLNASGNAAKVSWAGVKHFLTKPYTASSLLKTLRAILDEA